MRAWPGGHGADLPTTLQAVAAKPVWAPVDHYLLASMLNADFRPQFPIALIAKDFGYTVDAAGGPERAPTLAAVHALFEQGVARGLGGDNMTGVLRLLAA